MFLEDENTLALHGKGYNLVDVGNGIEKDVVYLLFLCLIDGLFFFSSVSPLVIHLFSTQLDDLADVVLHEDLVLLNQHIAISEVVHL